MSGDQSPRDVEAKAGALKGYRATAYSPMVQQALHAEGAEFLDQPVVISGPQGRIITGRDPPAAPAFAEALRRALLEPAPP